jgi:hypothetical protein
MSAKLTGLTEGHSDRRGVAARAMASDHSSGTFIPEYGSPLWRSGLMMRPAALPARHG